MAIGAKGEIEIAEHVAEIERVRLAKRTLKHRPGHFEADEIVIRLRCVVAASHLQDIESELHLQMR